MGTTALVSVMGFLTVVAIYFWWARKVGDKAPEAKATPEPQQTP